MAAHSFVKIGASLAFLALSATLALADAPSDIVKKLYATATAKNAPPILQTDATLKQFFTASFQAVARSIAYRQTKTNEAILDFDPILDTNGDVDAKNLVLATLGVQGGQAIVKATFGTGADRRSVAYSVTLENGAWRIDDIMSPPETKGEMAWSVRKISIDDLLLTK